MPLSWLSNTDRLLKDILVAFKIMKLGRPDPSSIVRQAEDSLGGVIWRQSGALWPNLNLSSFILFCFTFSIRVHAQCPIQNSSAYPSFIMQVLCFSFLWPDAVVLFTARDLKTKITLYKSPTDSPETNMKPPFPLKERKISPAPLPQPLHQPHKECPC